MELHPAIEELVRQLARRPEVTRIVLFGSRARGTHRERADVDLAIEAPDASIHDWFDMLDQGEEAETLLSIDMVRLDEAPEELLRSINAEGVQLYVKPGRMA